MKGAQNDLATRAIYAACREEFPKKEMLKKENDIFGDWSETVAYYREQEKREQKQNPEKDNTRTGKVVIDSEKIKSFDEWEKACPTERAAVGVVDFKEITSSEEWAKATPAARAAVEKEYATDFWTELSKTSLYKNTTKDNMEKFKTMFSNKFESGRAVINELEGIGGENLTR